MAEGAIALEIVTPDGVALSEAVDDLTAPSVHGEFGVLPGHRPLLAALKTGIMSYHKADEEVRLAVGPGFVEISADKAILLTDCVAHKEDIDPVKVRLELKQADEDLDRFDGEHGSPEHVEIIRRELWAAARLTLYGDPPPATVHTLYESLAAGETFTEPEDDESDEGEGETED